MQLINVVDCINKKVKIDAIDMVIQDCRVLMSSLSNVNVMFVKRDQNVALTKSGISNYS
jgi:hypothetical protein